MLKAKKVQRGNFRWRKFSLSEEEVKRLRRELKKTLDSLERAKHISPETMQMRIDV